MKNEEMNIESIKAINKNVVDILGDEKTVKLTLADLLNTFQQYEVTVNNVKDYYRLSTIKNYKCGLYFVNFEDNDIHILAAGVQDKETMYVYFDKKINQEDAVQLSYYQISGVTDANYLVYPTKVVYEPEKRS